ncbi:sodium-coupled monocarboxylate transporter 1-like [Cherax quadricarinatus]|uniref:sodium-coupled monocarboxylate transporter 1-like n=1 Tax=Cherax quadricarinatus TaxID=27406 RepID=UPI00387E3C8B
MGICAPWVNAKGAIAGFVTTFVFSIWVVIGKFVRGGGSPPLLPLSVQGCPENLVNFNTTISNLITNTSVINTLLANPTIVNGLTVNTSIPDDLRDITSIASDLINTTNVQESSAKTIYEISYCFSGVINLAITFVVSSVVSVLTGVVHPKAEDGVVCRVCGRIYLRLWQLFSNHNTCT